MSRPVRIGVVGVGTIAQRGILPHLTQADVGDRVVVQAVCDPAPGRAEAAAERFGVPKHFSSVEEMLATGDIDAVTVASPIGFHYQHGHMALKAGKHVHFNKTMATTVAEADELIGTAAQSGLKIVASPGEILRSRLTRTRELIAEGAIGTLCWATCGAAFGTYHEDEQERQGDTALSNIDPSWYFRKPGGGPLYDVTVYALHGLTSVLGSAKRVTALSGLRIRERAFKGKLVPCDADDNTLMLLDFGEGMFAFVYGTPAGSLSRKADATFSASYFGSTGKIVASELNDEPFPYPGRELADQAPGWDGEQWLLPHVTGVHRSIEENHVFEDIMQLVDWVREGKPSPVTAEHSRHVVDIIESGFRAAETGQTQELRTTIDGLRAP